MLCSNSLYIILVNLPTAKNNKSTHEHMLGMSKVGWVIDKN